MQLCQTQASLTAQRQKHKTQHKKTTNKYKIDKTYQDPEFASVVTNYYQFHLF